MRTVWVCGAVALVAAFSGRAEARAPGRVTIDATSPVTGPDGVKGLVTAQPSRFGLVAALADGLELEADAAPVGARGFSRVTLRGRYAGGIPLATPVVTALVDERAGTVRLWARGPAIPSRLSLAPPTITEAEALARLHASAAPGSAGGRDAQLVAVPGASETTLAWRIDPPLDRGTLTNPVFLVDARTGQVVIAHDRVRTAVVRAFENNPVVDPAAAVFELVDVDPNPENLTGPYFIANNCVEPGFGDWCDPLPMAVPDMNGNFLYPAPDVDVPAEALAPFDEFAETSIYYHSDKFLGWLFGHGFDGFLCNALGGKANLVANFKTYAGGEWEPFDNAFFSGDCDMTMVFGQGSSVDLSYDGDVVYHELGHGVVEAHVPDGFLGELRPRPRELVVDAGAMNEAIADYLSSAFTNDSIVGDYLGQYWLGQEGVRNNDNDYLCPGSLIGEVHADSEVFAGALWRGHQALGEPLVDVVLESLRYLPNDATFEEASAVLVEVAAAMLGPADAQVLQSVLEARGLFDCPRALAWDELRDTMFVEPPGDYDPYPPPPLQLWALAPEGVDTMEVRFSYSVYTGPFGEGGFASPNVLVRSGSPVTFEYAGGAFGTSVSHNAEAELLDLTDGQFSVSVVGGSRVFMAFGNSGSDRMRVEIDSVEFSQVGPTTTSTSGTSTSTSTTGPSTSTSSSTTTGPATATATDTDDPTGSQDELVLAGRGCACTTSGRPHRRLPAGLALVLSLGLVTRRRRPY